ASEQACDRTLRREGISRRLCRRWIRHGEEVVGERQRVDERGVERDETFRDPLTCQVRLRVLIHAEGATQELAQHAKGSRPCVRQAVHLDDGEAPSTTTLDELLAQTALAD